LYRSALTAETLYSGLTAEEREKLEKESTTTVYDKGQFIFYQESQPFGVFVLLSGKVKLFKTGSEGKNQIFQICREGDLFGYHAVLAGDAFPDSASALEQSSVRFIPKGIFTEIVKGSSRLSYTMLQAMSRELRNFLDQEILLAQKSVRERVALTLFFLERIYRTPAGPAVVHLSRSDLADLSGTVKESLVRVLTEFRNKGYIATTRTSVEIIAPDKLARIADFPIR